MVKSRAQTHAVFGDKTSPLYITIAGVLRSEIQAGKLSLGMRLPTIDQLSANYGVAKVTVREALRVLSEEKLITSQQGRGTFVSERPGQRRSVRLQSDWGQLLGDLSGNKPELLELCEQVSDLPHEHGDGVSTGDYRFMRRIHASEGEPYCLIEIYLDRATYEASPKAFDSQMVIPTLQNVPGLMLKQMRQLFQIGTADMAKAAAIGVAPNTPVGIVRRVIVDEEDRIIYLGTGCYRSDLVVFETVIDVKGKTRDR